MGNVGVAWASAGKRGFNRLGEVFMPADSIDVLMECDPSDEGYEASDKLDSAGE